MSYTASRIQASLGEFAAGDHLGDDEPGAVLVGTAAKRFVGDAGHGRQKHAVAYFDAAYRQRLCEPADFNHA